MSNRFQTMVIFCLGLFIFSSCATQPPKEKGNFKPNDLVEIIKQDTSIHLDIRYATSNNFMRRPMYTEARTFLQRPAAEALVRANQHLKPLGYGLLVFDGYRPWNVTRAFWNSVSVENRKFVADPKKGSKHNRGCAVDLSLYSLTTGKEIEMTGAYDEMSERSYSAYKGGTQEQRKTRQVLKENMEAEGFKVIENEWWHFDYKDWQLYPITNIPFSQIK